MLIGEGWRVEVSGQLIRTAGALTAEVRSGIDWFDLNASVAFGDSSASLPALLAALGRGDRTIALSDGTLGLLADDALDRLRSLAAPARRVTEDFARPDAGRAARRACWPRCPPPGSTMCSSVHASSSDDFDRVAPSKRPRACTGRFALSERRDSAGALPARLSARGVLATTWDSATVQLLAGSRRGERPARPFVVVVPTIADVHGGRRSARFAPALRVLETPAASVGAPCSDPRPARSRAYHLRRAAPRRSAARGDSLDYVVLDEAQVIKKRRLPGPKGRRSLDRAASARPHGTPVENRLGESMEPFRVPESGDARRRGGAEGCPEVAGTALRKDRTSSRARCGHSSFDAPNNRSRRTFRSARADDLRGVESKETRPLRRASRSLPRLAAAPRRARRA